MLYLESVTVSKFTPVIYNYGRQEMILYIRMFYPWTATYECSGF